MFTWIVVGLFAWIVGLLCVLALMRVSGDEDRYARHEEKLLNPLSDVPITQSGNGR